MLFTDFKRFFTYFYSLLTPVAFVLTTLQFSSFILILFFAGRRLSWANSSKNTLQLATGLQLCNGKHAHTRGQIYAHTDTPVSV